MKGELIKISENTYRLEVNNSPFYYGHTSSEFCDLPNKDGSYTHKLSLKNCQEIERDNPTEEYILEVNGDGWDDHSYKGKRKKTEWDVEIIMEKYGYCEGCRKAGMWHCAHADTCGNAVELERPLLDACDCLILKRT